MAGQEAFFNWGDPPLANQSDDALAGRIMDDVARQEPNRAIRVWLSVVALFIMLVVVVGGATRLTDSGLSITEWRPIMGMIPPLSEADWAAAFGKYQLIPEYELQNKGMSLADFKVIFWWEWAHRFLARTVGIIFAVPFAYFALRGRISRALWPRMLLLLLLGAAQGGLGWFMVYSGLSERVDVSQYRLAAHLTLAAFIFAAVIWTGLGIGRLRTRPSTLADYVALFLVPLILLQIAAGGFVAGIDAGMGYNTWPKMDGAWIPQGLWVIEPAWRNIFENALTVQFHHRLLAYIILLFTAWHVWNSFTPSAFAVFYITLAQVGIGITTLLFHVPIPLALLHQAAAFVLLASAVWNAHQHLVMPSPVQDRR